MATVPADAAQGILGFIKAKEGAPGTIGTGDEFKAGNYWHLKAGPLGEPMTVELVTSQPPISLAQGEIPTRAGELATVLTFFHEKKKTPSLDRSTFQPTVSTNFGGKKRHAKTAHKRKQGRSRKLRKAKK